MKYKKHRHIGSVVLLLDKRGTTEMLVTLNCGPDTPVVMGELLNSLFWLWLFLGWLGSFDTDQLTLAAGIVIGMADSCLPACLHSLPVLTAARLHTAIVHLEPFS